ncbi:MAG: DUF1232 domain-containing protein [Phycisphaeraceae bacterium]|nr:DUF1232 domain-containing protein [Phycisphaeraceae bacterium]
MEAFFSFLKVFVLCGSLMFIVMLGLLALPASRLRCVGLEISKWAMCIGLALLTISPLDLAPDAIPLVGWLDDCGYVIAAIAAARSAIADGKKRKLYEEIELNNLQGQARKGERQ